MANVSNVAEEFRFVEIQNTSTPEDFFVGSLDIKPSKTAPIKNTTEAQTQTNTVSTLSKENEQIFDLIKISNGRFVRDERGRIKIVYPDDDCIENEYYSSVPYRVLSNAHEYSEEFKTNINMCMQGIEQQKINKYPFSVLQNPQAKTRLQTSKRGKYRKDREYKTVESLYKHPLAFTMVEIVQDTFTGFRHICKSVIISKFRREEVEGMIQIPEFAPSLYGIYRDGEHVRIHMEYIHGTSADQIAQCLQDRNTWPFCLYMFSQLTKAIQKLGLDRLSHGDIHVKNILIETENDGSSLRISLIDYGDATKHSSASQYTLSGLMRDMSSIVSCVITVFTGNGFDGYEEDPGNWIKEFRERFPQFCAILQGALMVRNEEHLSKLISDLSLIIKDERGYNENIGDLATKLFSKTVHVSQSTIPNFEKIDISGTDAIAIGNFSQPISLVPNNIALPSNDAKGEISPELQTTEGGISEEKECPVGSTDHNLMKN